MVISRTVNIRQLLHACIFDKFYYTISLYECLCSVNALIENTEWFFYTLFSKQCYILLHVYSFFCVGTKCKLQDT